MFCGKLFCHLQQTVKGLLFFRLLNQFCKQDTEYIGAVLPQCNCNVFNKKTLDKYISKISLQKGRFVLSEFCHPQAGSHRFLFQEMA